MADSDPIQPRVIWLSPMCKGCDDPDGGQLWCVDPQDDCDDCGLGWTRYVIDEAQAAAMVDAYRRPKLEDDDA